MSLFHIALRSILQRGVASLLTIFSMSLGVMLVVAVLSIHGVVSQSFKNNASLGYNVIVGAKGGREQLVLNTVYYLSQPVENIPYTLYLEFLERPERDKLQAESYAWQGSLALAETAELAALTGGGGLAGVARQTVLAREQPAFVPEMTISHYPPVEFGRHGKYGQMTRLAIPLCLGDYFGRFRVVGTTPALFDDFVWDIENNRKFEFAQGRNFEWHNQQHGYFETVLGANVAREITLTELQIQVAADLDTAAALVAEETSWSRIEKRGETLVVTLGQGVADSDFRLALKRVQNEVAKGRRTLSAEEDKTLAALLSPQAVVRSASRSIALGDAISPAHGSPEGHKHARKFTVVGILRPSGTPNDRAVFINMEGFYLMEDHATPVERQKVAAGEQPPLSEAEEKAQLAAKVKKELEVLRADNPDPLPVEQRQVTAILLRVDAVFAPGIESAISKGNQAQAVFPVAVITRLFESFVKPVQWTLLFLTAMICVVSGISILVSIYNSMSERRGEIAVMRALGAGRGTVMGIILLEATILALAGGVLGWLTGHAGCLLASPLIEEQTGVLVGFLNKSTLPAEAALIPALMLLAVLVGIWPAVSAYRTDVARSLGK